MGNLIHHGDCKSSFFHLGQVLTKGFAGPGTLSFFCLAFFQDVPMSHLACNLLFGLAPEQICVSDLSSGSCLAACFGKIGVLWSHHWKRFALHAHFVEDLV